MIASSGSSSGRERQAGALDVGSGRGRRGDEDLVSGGDTGVGERHQRADVPGAARRGEEDAHTGLRRRDRAPHSPAGPPPTPSLEEQASSVLMIPVPKKTRKITIQGVIPPLVGPELSAPNHEPTGCRRPGPVSQRLGSRSAPQMAQPAANGLTGSRQLGHRLRSGIANRMAWNPAQRNWTVVERATRGVVDHRRVLITSEFLTEYQPPDLGEDANFFVVARTEGFGEDEGNGGSALGVGWIEDRTRVTDSAVLAVAWALLLTGVADDGSNPLPLARVRAFARRPAGARRGRPRPARGRARRALRRDRRDDPRRVRRRVRRLRARRPASGARS